MATLSRGQTFGSSETVTNTKLHNLVDLGAVSSIINADISASADIEDTKLADITTGNKVRGSALGNLASIPSGAGVIPFINIGNIGQSLASIPNTSLLPISLTSWVDGSAMRNIQSMPSLAGNLAWYSIVSSLASGGLPIYDGLTKFIGKLPSEVTPSTSNVIYAWSGMTNSHADTRFLVNASLNASTSQTYCYYGVKGSTYREVIGNKWIKINGVRTLTIYALIWTTSALGATADCLVDMGGQQGSVSGTVSQTTPEWKTFTVDVSSLSNGTTYDLSVQLRLTTDVNNYAYLGSIVILGS